MIPRPNVVRRLAVTALAVATILALAACSGPTTITVHGKVTDTILTPFGTAFPGVGANAYIAGTAVPLNPDGTFTISAVQPPYDLIVTVPTWNAAYVYLGLTRSDPTLSLFTDSSAFFTGDVSLSIGSAVPSGQMGAIVAGSTGLVQQPAMLNAGDGPAIGPITFAWGGEQNRPVTLYALTAVGSGGGPPTSFTGFGSTTATLQDGGTLSGLSINLGSVTNATMSGSISAPSGYTVDSAGVVLRLGSPTGALLGIGPGSGGGATFTGVSVPVHSGIAYGIAGSASNGSGRGTRAWRNVAGPGSGLTLALPAPAVPTAPASGATGVGTGTTFRWTPLASAVYLAELTGPSASDPDVYVVTGGTSFDLPDLSAVGMSLPSAASYGYRVLAMGPFASVDAFAGPSGGTEPYIQLLTLFSTSGIPYGDGNTDASSPVFFTASEAFSFTTAP